MSAARDAADVGGAGREPMDPAERFGRPWHPVPTVQTMRGGETWRTWGVQTADGLWVGRAHPIGSEPEAQALAKHHAMLFAASEDMAAVLTEALAVFRAEFETDQHVPGSELTQWLAAWRQRAEAALGKAGTP